MPRRKKQKTETRSVPDLVEDFMDEDWEVLESVEVCENSDLTTVSSLLRDVPKRH